MVKPPPPPEETYAGKAVDLLVAAIERAVAQGGLAGDRALLEQLRREVAAVKSGATRPEMLPARFKGTRQRIFEALLRGCNRTEAAKQAKCSRQQVYRYLKEPDFVAALVEARSERHQAALSKLEDLQPLALRRLEGILLDPCASDRDVIAAAKEVMDRGGIPKTERVEHSGEVRTTDTSRDPDELMARLAVLRGGLDG